MKRGEIITGRIEAILRGTGWSASQLAEQIGVSRRAVEFWLMGKATSHEVIGRIDELENRLTSPTPVEDPASPPAPRFNSLAFSSKAFAVRKGLNMSQQEIGEVLEMSGRTYGRLEAGDAVPGTQVRKSVVEAYKRLYGYRNDPADVLKWLRGGEVKPMDSERTAQQQLFETMGQNGKAIYVPIRELNDRRDASRMSLEIRKRHELTQSALAEMLGSTQTRVCRIEQCRLTPSPDELSDLRRILEQGLAKELVVEASVQPEPPAEQEDSAPECRADKTILTLTPQRFAQMMRLMEWLQGVPEETVEVLRSLSPLEWEYLQKALP